MSGLGLAASASLLAMELGGRTAMAPWVAIVLIAVVFVALWLALVYWFAARETKTPHLPRAFRFWRKAGVVFAVAGLSFAGNAFFGWVGEGLARHATDAWIVKFGTAGFVVGLALLGLSLWALWRGLVEEMHEGNRRE